MMMPNVFFMKDMSRGEFAHLLDLVHACTACITREELKEVVGYLSGVVPFDFFTCVYAHIDVKGICEPYHVINVSYPDEWMKLYMDRSYHLIDPVLKENFTNFSLQYWDDTYAAYPPDEEFRAAAEDFGLCSGYTSGVRDLTGNRGGLFSFAGRKMERDSQAEAVIEFITPHMFQALERIISTDRIKKAPVLTSREKEVLKWVAYGKTTWETSVIMGIGERTVKFHVNNLMKKLNAVSRTHVTAIASELGLVDLD